MHGVHACLEHAMPPTSSTARCLEASVQHCRHDGRSSDAPPYMTVMLCLSCMGLMQRGSGGRRAARTGGVVFNSLSEF